MEEDIERRKSKLNKFFFGWIKDNYDKIFLVLLFLAFIIRIWIFFKTMNQPIWWDAGDYLSAAKRWAGLNPNMLDIWYYRRGFFWPLFGTIFFKTGLGEIGIRFFITLFSTGIVAVSYFLIKKMFNKKLALLTTLCLTFSWILLFFSGRPLTNIPSAFFLLLFLLLFWKGYVLKEGDKFLYLSGIFYALAALTRMQNLMFLIPIFIFIFSREKFKFLKNKKLWITLGIFLLVMTPQLIIHYQHFGNPVADLMKYYLGIGGSQTGEIGAEIGQPSKLFSYITNLPYMLDGNEKGYTTLFALSPIYILFVIGFFYFFIDLFLGFDKIFKDEKIQKRLFVLMWIVVIFILLGYITIAVEQRYVMETLPFLFLIAVFPLLKLGNFIKNKSKLSNKFIFASIAIVLMLLLIPNFLFGNNLIEAKKTSYLEVKQAGEWIKENSNLTDIVVTSSLPQITYYSERIVYPFNLAYRRDLEEKNETDFNEFVLKNHPRYLVISAYEVDYDWVFQYPEKHKNILVPVKVYYKNEQPILVIYEFKYS